MRDTNISEASKDMIDAKYALGDRSRGFDCLNSILQFYREMGVEFAKDFKGWTEDNYASKFANNPDEGRKALIEWIMTLGRDIDTNYFKPGDLMIFKQGEYAPFPAIYLGSSNVLLVTGKDHGSKVFPLKTVKQHFGKLISVKRLIG